MQLLIKLSDKFYLEFERYKKIIKQHNIFCASFLLAKKFLTSVSSFSIALLIILFRPFGKIYLVRLNSSRIGHFALSTELMLSEFEMNPDKLKGKIILFYLRISAANQQLLKMCKRSILILPYPRLCFHIDNWLQKLIGKEYKNDFVKYFESNEILSDNHGGDGGDKNGVFRKTKTHLSFTRDELIRGQYLLEQFGVQRDSKFVCLLVRDHAYMNKEFPDSDCSHHSIRNVDIRNYKKAALYLAEKGYYVFRMGKHVEQAFDISHPRIIDYANHALRSDFLDIYLSAHCYFFISTGSGLDSIACMFRRPKLITNITLPENLSVWYPLYFFTYKKIWDKKNKSYLSLKRMIEIGMIKPGISADILQQHDLELIENTEDEILNAVRDMEAQLDGTLKEVEEDKVAQQKFVEIFSSVRKNQHIFIKISPSFYKQGSIALE